MFSAKTLLRITCSFRFHSSFWFRSSSFCNQVKDQNSGKEDKEQVIFDSVVNRAFRHVYFRTLPLRRQPELKGKEKEICESIETEARQLCWKHRERVVDDRSAAHIHLSSMALSSYKTLLPLLDSDEERVLNIVGRGFGLADVSSSSKSGLQWILQFMLLVSLNKLRTLKRMAENIERDFGKGFDIVQESEVDSNNKLVAHQMVVRRCLYHDFFVAEGYPQVTRLFCALDRSYFGEVKEKRHGDIS
ncbi:hypothetical protein Gasu_04630 isoform 2 [Galdieria sulphuraria]|uniref:Uncharacterized protein n=1 Tax=Galdieria sulphuraria TaxID=130081 RepID=M2XQ86_GALSU|nr:hypothetical protein Gasu_04630 isoform 2 [Galdieria sulphuraria]EME32372.1 hypothetical protein isoform 2 [Galdieria sulphuraria]|eukprot:XP_005708892.1 hypothetical protein isoform 2 [Galdieria sulphuraria]